MGHGGERKKGNSIYVQNINGKSGNTKTCTWTPAFHRFLVDYDLNWFSDWMRLNLCLVQFCSQGIRVWEYFLSSKWIISIWQETVNAPELQLCVPLSSVLCPPGGGRWVTTAPPGGESAERELLLLHTGHWGLSGLWTFLIMNMYILPFFLIWHNTNTFIHPITMIIITLQKVRAPRSNTPLQQMWSYSFLSLLQTQQGISQTTFPWQRGKEFMLWKLMWYDWKLLNSF